MQDIESHFKIALKKGYDQNILLHTSYIDRETSIVEYLLTVNVAQQLISWNEHNHWGYSIHLEYPTEKFFKNAFLPYMQVGDNIFDIDIIHPEVTKSISHNEKIRTGRLDLAVCTENIEHLDFNESVYGIELKGINPSLDKVFEDIERLIIAIEMKDENFQNSIKAGYCLHIKKLGGDKRISSRENLENAMQSSLKNIDKAINERFKSPLTKINVSGELISIMSSEDFAKMGNAYDLSASEVAEGTKIVFSVIIKITK